jgi:hypothetical protein
MANLTLVHVFHAYASADTLWVAMHYPIIHPLGMAGYLPSQWHMTLLSLVIPYVPYVSVHSSACSFGLNRRGP